MKLILIQNINIYLSVILICTLGVWKGEWAISISELSICDVYNIGILKLRYDNRKCEWYKDKSILKWMFCIEIFVLKQKMFCESYLNSINLFYYLYSIHIQTLPAWKDRL